MALAWRADIRSCWRGGHSKLQVFELTSSTLLWSKPSAGEKVAGGSRCDPPRAESLDYSVLKGGGFMAGT